MIGVKRGVSLLIVATFLVASLAAFFTLVTVVPEAEAKEVECSWGQIKCCYGDDPCHNACCPRPKDPPGGG